MKTQEKCPRGCYLYDSFDDVSLVVCPLCKTPRCGKQQKFVSIGQKLAQVLTNEEKRDLLSQGRHEREPVVTQDGKKIYSDIFDGETYNKLKIEHFKDQYDIGIVLHIDGFKPGTSHEASHIINCIIMNFDPSIR